MAKHSTILPNCLFILIAALQTSASPAQSNQSLARSTSPGTNQAKVDFHGDALPPGAIARFGSLRMRHQGAITTAVYSPDGKWLASAGEGRAVVHLWDAATGKEIWRIDEGKSAGALGSGVERLIFSPCGTKLAACPLFDKRFFPKPIMGNDVVMLDAATGKKLWAFKDRDQPVIAMAFAENGKTIVSVDSKGAVLWCDAASGKLLKEWRPLDQFRPEGLGPQVLSDVRHAAISADGGKLAIDVLWGRQRGAREQLLVLDLSNQSALWHQKLSSTQSILFFSPDGKLLAFEGELGIVVGDAHNGKIRFHADIEGRSFTLIHCGSFASDNCTLALASIDYQGMSTTGGSLLYSFPNKREVHLFNAVSGHRQKSFSVADGTSLADQRFLAFSPDGKTLAINGDDSKLTKWDLGSGQQLGALPGHDDSVHFVCFSDNQCVRSGSGGTWRFPQCLLSWSLNTGEIVKQSKAIEIDAFTRLPNYSGIGFVEENHLLEATYAKDGSLNVLDRSSGERLYQLTPPSYERNYKQIGLFSPGGGLVLFLEKPATEEWSVREARTGKRLYTFQCPAESRIAFGPQENLMAWHEAKGTVQVADMRTGKLVHSLGSARDTNKSKLEHATLALTDQHVAAWDSDLRAIRVWNLASGKELWRVGSKETIPVRRQWTYGLYSEATPAPDLCLSFSPDGRTLAVGGLDGGDDIHLWEVSSGKLRRKITGHRGPVESLAFSKNGRLLISGSRDATALVWDLCAAD